ncbi:hypothetical protein AVEN_130506-1 [Araneus ventricosus]|uniref:Uncharacterized protein n=1 Tax=Araneus ventricosus TaxID=182803 RepID=A0A4Y2EKX9_ARAVE|nr:hypothetical protein AVEN_130506-1 [Araneus ventricosus]
MTRTTPELAPPSPNFRATPTGGRLATTYDLACNRPHTRRIFSGIGFRTPFWEREIPWEIYSDETLHISSSTTDDPSIVKGVNGANSGMALNLAHCYPVTLLEKVVLR